MKSMPTRLAKSVRNSTNVFYASSKKRTKKPTPSHSMIFTLMLTNLATLRNLRRFSWIIYKRKKLRQTRGKHNNQHECVFCLEKSTQNYAYKSASNLRKRPKIRIESFLFTCQFLLSFTHAIFLVSNYSFRRCPFSFLFHN